MLNIPPEKSIGLVDKLAIAIIPSTILNGAHAGVLYVSKVGEAPRLIHLATHKWLIDETASNEIRWVQVQLNAITARLVVGVCLSIARRARAREMTATYGFNYDPAKQYFGVNYDFLPIDPNQGLTCATFVLALFRRADVELLKVEEWLERNIEVADVEVQKAIAETFSATFGEEVGKILYSQIASGAPRFRPEQVAAASALSPKPVGFDVANSKGQELIDSLKRSYSSAS